MLEPCEAPKLVPVIVTEAPTGLFTGERLVRCGVCAAVERAERQQARIENAMRSRAEVEFEEPHVASGID